MKRLSRMWMPAAVLVLGLWPCASLRAQAPQHADTGIGAGQAPQYAAAGIAAGQDYEIRLHRPQVVGQKYHLSAEARSSRTQLVKSGDKTQKNDTAKFSVQCDCVVTVLAVDDKGKPSKLSLQIEKLIRTDDVGVQELVSKGSLITVSMDKGNEICDMGGHRLSLPTQEAIIAIMPLDPNGPTEDELYGTSQRRKPGDHWDANTDLMVRDLLRRSASANKEDLTGTVDFEKVVNVGKIPCLQISGSMDCTQYIPFVPSDVKVEKGFLKIRFSKKLPVAASLPALETTQSTNYGYTMKGRLDPAGEEITVDVGAMLTTFSRVSDATQPASQ